MTIGNKYEITISFNTKYSEGNDTITVYGKNIPDALEMLETYSIQNWDCNYTVLKIELIEED